MSRQVVNNTPTRKTLVTGQTLPALKTEFRPIPLGRDENGEPDGQVRAFAVLIRNRADSPVFVREGPTDDSNRVDSGESFHIWEPNGVNNISVKGENGGESVEFRVLEAHNDFDITDKIDAFTRALSHFFGTATRTTEVTAIGDSVTIDDIQAASATFDVAGSVDIGDISDSITVSDIQAGTVDIGQFSDTVTIDDIQAGDVTVSGEVDIAQIADKITVSELETISDTITVDDIQAGSVDADVSGNVTVDDINATSANFDGDITGQTDFDLSATTRKGQTEVISVDGQGLSAGTQDDDFNIFPDYYHYNIRDNAAYDGRIDRVEFRAYDYNQVDSLGFEAVVDYGSTGSWTEVSPRPTADAELCEKISVEQTDAYLSRYYPDGEVVIVWEPREPPTFEAGDSVAVNIGPIANTAGSGDYDAELEVTVTDIVSK